LLPDVRDQLLHSRSARDLIALAAAQPDLLRAMVPVRPALQHVASGLDDLRMALERERFAAMDADQRRLETFVMATAAFERRWPEIEQRCAGLPLRQAHAIVVESAAQCLPMAPATAS